MDDKAAMARSKGVSHLKAPNRGAGMLIWLGVDMLNLSPRQQRYPVQSASDPVRYRGSIWKSDMCKTFNRFPCSIMVTLIQIRRKRMEQRSERTLGGGTTLELGSVVL